MRNIFGRGAQSGGLFNENQNSPWGSGGGSGGDGSDGTPNPWGQPPRKRRPGGGGGINPLDELIKKGRDRFGGQFPGSDGRPYWLYGLGIVLLMWIGFTSVHIIGSQERGVITRFGKYAGTLQPGMGLTFPAPIDKVEKLDVAAIRSLPIGTTDGNEENLVLTVDENIVDMAYQVRWNIKDPERFLFRLRDPEKMIGEVAQSAMRETIAKVSLDDAIGSGRAAIEQQTTERMQQVLDAYGAGVAIQGVSVKQSDPPAQVNDAFKEVSAAQQDAQSSINQARAYALQLTAQAQGAATAFDKVYVQYKLAPEVTRRRMYYETMEEVLSKVDKTVVEAPGVTPYLALPQVRSRAQEGAAQ